MWKTNLLTFHFLSRVAAALHGRPFFSPSEEKELRPGKDLVVATTNFRSRRIRDDVMFCLIFRCHVAFGSRARSTEWLSSQHIPPQSNYDDWKSWHKDTRTCTKEECIILLHKLILSQQESNSRLMSPRLKKICLTCSCPHRHCLCCCCLHSFMANGHISKVT